MSHHYLFHFYILLDLFANSSASPKSEVWNDSLALPFFCVVALPTPNSTSTFSLQALKMLAIASSSEIPNFVTGRDSVHPLFDAQMTREIFASIDSATRPGSESLLLTVPAAVILMLNTEGSGHHPPNC